MVLYLITNLINGKHYVGKTVRSLRKRWTKHLSDARRGSQTYLNNAIRKRGPEAFSIVPLVSILTTDLSLKEQEKFWIRLFRSNDPRYGYNLTAGGDGMVGYRASAETRRKMSEAHKGKNFSAEHRRKLSEAKRGKPGHPNSLETRRRISAVHKGKTLSVETRRKIGNAQKGNKHSEGRIVSAETRRKIGDAHKGKTLSMEHRRKIGDAGKGRRSPALANLNVARKGKSLPAEHRRKISAALKGKRRGEVQPWLFSFLPLQRQAP